MPKTCERVGSFPERDLKPLCMKKIFSLVAIVIAISASAFTAVKGGQHYYFIGTSGDLLNPEMYVTVLPEEISCQPEGSLPCQVQVPFEFDDKEDWLEAAENDLSILEDGIISKRP
jgi:hypothetical protein